MAATCYFLVNESQTIVSGSVIAGILFCPGGLASFSAFLNVLMELDIK